MNNSRYLLLLFGLAFLCIQAVSFMANIASHEERLDKLEKLAIQVDNGDFLDLKMDPRVEIIKEKSDFRNSVIGFIIKLSIILGATLFVYSIIVRKSRNPEES